MPPRKGASHIGMERVLNDPNSSFLVNPQVFNQIKSASGMPFTEIFRQIGKGRKAKGPTDKERSKERIEKLEADSDE